MEIIATNALISINATFIVQMVSFLIFLYLMNRIMFRPLLNIMEQRNDYIDDVKKDIRTGTDNLNQLMNELDEERAKVVQEAGIVSQSIESDGEQQASKMVEEARQQIISLRQETEKQVDDQIRQARQALASEVDAIAETIMENVLHRRLTP